MEKMQKIKEQKAVCKQKAKKENRSGIPIPRAFLVLFCTILQY